jgi:short-subunit dehydrogenase
LTAEEVRQLGGQAVVATADLADRTQLDGAFAVLRQGLGPVDILVNNAGIGCWGPFVEIPEYAARRVIDLNLMAVLHLTRLVVPEMLGRRRGHVVNVGSIAGRLGVPFESIYSVTKFGLAGFTEALAVEVRPFGVGVSMVNPGPVATDFATASGWPTGPPRWPRPIPPERVAQSVIAAVEHGGLERVIPRWLRVAHGVRSVVPAAYTLGVRRAMARQLAEFERRWAARE